MKANNLTICVPSSKGLLRECNKNCPYCISRITWTPEVNESLMWQNLQTVKKILELRGIHDILITGKGEPLMNPEFLTKLMYNLRDYKLEIQTNGILLSESPFLGYDSYQNWKEFFVAGRLNVLAVSVDNVTQIRRSKDLWKSFHDAGIIVRVCVNITNIFQGFGFKDIVEMARESYASQVLFRNITYPSTAPTDSNEVQWINKNVNLILYKDFLNQMKALRLPSVRYIDGVGCTVFDYKGTAVMFSDYCLEESSSEVNGARSLIFHQDGHVYTSWNTPASILF